MMIKMMVMLLTNQNDDDADGMDAEMIMMIKMMVMLK